MKNVLIFPAGTEIAFEIVNALKFSKFVHLFGGTSVRDHSEFIFKDLITGFPYIDEEGFLEFLNDVIEEYEIDCIYPAHDSACLFMSANSENIKAQVIISDYKTTNICRSKKETYNFFAGEEFIPKTYSSADKVDEFPVFVKPTVGQGSKGALLIKSKEELIAALNKDNTLVICEYLPGMEYTVDCFTDRYGNLRTAKMRDRERIRTGISVRSRILPEENDVTKIANVINEKLNFRGAWFFQLKKNKMGEYRLLEISPRIPGTMGLSRNLGINYPMLTLFDFWDYDVSIIENNYDLMVDRAFYGAYQMALCYEHIYLDYDDTLIINGKVNSWLMMYLYQANSKGIKIHLLSKHIGNLREDLLYYNIPASLFDEITIIGPEDEKTPYIKEKNAIFIDDSFAERKKIHDKLNIPVFDLDMIESLIDWRC